MIIQGDAIVYTHALLHEGSVVVKGTKYVLRCDIMFGKQQTAAAQTSSDGCIIV
jgi:hypothetical protein